MAHFNKHRLRAEARPIHQARLGLEMLEHRVVLSTFHVNTLLDSTVVNLKNGKDASGHISLRSALQATNASVIPDVIILPAGTIHLTILGSDENNAATGDLDIRRNVTIRGSGRGQTIIDGRGRDRVFDILSATASISNVIVQNGRAIGNGGGLLNEGG